jgi:hypothetical protein
MPTARPLHIHLLASVSRVYGGFALALIVALPLGMLTGRVPLVRQLLDPTIQMLQPVPITAWLPLAMIIFGLGPRSAFFLVFLGAFYPILGNTIFGVRSVEPRLFEAASMFGCSESAQFFRVVLPCSAAVDLHRHVAWTRLCLGRDRGRRDDRRPDGAGRHHHGSRPALAHRNRDFRNDRHRGLRLSVRSIGHADWTAFPDMEPIAWLKARSPFSN